MHRHLALGDAHAAADRDYVPSPVRCPLTAAQRDRICARALALVGRAYDYPAYTGFALRVLKVRDGAELNPVFKADHWRVCSELVADCQAPMEVVGRFLALLELYRSRTVAFDQSEPLGVLQISWTGERPTNEALVEVRDES